MRPLAMCVFDTPNFFEAVHGQIKNEGFRCGQTTRLSALYQCVCHYYARKPLLVPVAKLTVCTKELPKKPLPTQNKKTGTRVAPWKLNPLARTRAHRTHDFKLYLLLLSNNFCVSKGLQKAVRHDRSQRSGMGPKKRILLQAFLLPPPRILHSNKLQHLIEQINLSRNCTHTA